MALAINIKEFLTHKQRIFATLNHNFNAVAHLAWQKWFCHGMAAFYNTFKIKMRFSIGVFKAQSNLAHSLGQLLICTVVSVASLKPELG